MCIRDRSMGNPRIFELSVTTRRHKGRHTELSRSVLRRGLLKPYQRLVQTSTEQSIVLHKDLGSWGSPVHDRRGCMRRVQINSRIQMQKFKKQFSKPLGNKIANHYTKIPPNKICGSIKQ